MKRLWGWMISAITVVAVVVACLVLLPSLLGYKRYVIETGSMEPTLPVGTMVYSKPKPPEELQVGDIITYEPPADTNVDELVTHRIFSISHETPNQQAEIPAPDSGPSGPESRLIFKTKGDANEDPDPWHFVLGDKGAAREEHHLPYLGYVYLALGNSKVRLLVIIIPAILIMVLTALSLWRWAGEEQKEERARIERERLERERAEREKEPA